MMDGILKPMGRSNVFVVLLSLCLVGACKRDRSEEAPPKEREQTEQRVPAAKAGEQSKATKEHAQKLVEQWLLAQNEGSFDAYEKLYAQRFTGIKRVESRTQRFDRKGWMNDREAMFQRPFSVEAKEIRVVPAAASAVVEFVQVWNSATFRDEGQKQLVLVEEAGNMRIASEEMKSSRTSEEKKSAELPSPQEFSFVLHEPEALILVSSEVDLNAVSGTPEYVADSLARRSVVLRALSPEIQKLVGQKFTLYGSSGPVCESKIKDFDVLVKVQNHFGIVQGWNGTHGEPVTSRSERALHLWELSEAAGRFLVARLEDPGPCAGAVYARATDLPKPALWPTRDPQPEERASVIEVLRKTPLHMRLQKEFVAAYGKTSPWDDSGASPLFVVFDDGRGQVYASVTLSSGEEDSCASPFDVDVWFLLRKQGSSWTVLSAPPDEHIDSPWPRFLEPLHANVAVDVDGDGLPEFLGQWDFFREVDQTYRAVFNVAPGYFDCPC